ncbi:MAG: methionine synthase [Propionibacteriaceae bacterium]|nr:methionine synthase [Propionibacteriaceae bacterium]
MSADAQLRSVFGARTLVADGAMGTMLQGFSLTPEDFQGHEGCNEILNISRPDVVEQIHRAYLTAGADLIETNTLGANLSALREYSLEDRVEELAEAGAKIATQVARELSTDDQPRWVLGSVGPGTKIASLGQITYKELKDTYTTQVAAMIRGGIDAVLIETCQDLLGVRAAVAGAKKAIQEAQADCPIFVSVTVEATGTMLLGSDISAIVATLVPLGIDGLGLNCATGPDDMREYLRQLCDLSPIPVTCMPNAGMPVLSEGRVHYKLGAEEFATSLTGFVADFGLAMVGGCCGTTPDHIRALGSHRGPWKKPAKRKKLTSTGKISSLYTSTSLTQDVSYLSIGERTNASGSKAFREAMLAGNIEGCVEIAQSLVGEGAHVLDLCVDYVGRDGSKDMTDLAGRISREVDIPLQIDSSDPATIQAGLEHTPGRAIVNSVNLESGTEPGSKFATIMELVREHGSAVVGLCIDEQGHARTAEAKLNTANRLIELLTGEYGMDEADIIIDPLTFPVATGQDENRTDALATIEAVKLIKQAHPRVLTGLGISNVSFGLTPPARVVLNSIFLDECRKNGLDTGIVPAGKILPLERIPHEQAEAALGLLYNNQEHGDPIEAFIALFAGKKTATSTKDQENLSVSQRLHRNIVDGVRSGLSENLIRALEKKSAVDIINEDLLPAMKEVGENFGAGKTQLPFVLKSAEVMKQAVSFLEPHLDRVEETHKGTLVLATVRGDVHDIGKNLVDIILSNNGYRVINLGIKQPIADIISAATQARADAIGLSGLLVKSTQVMKEDLEALNHQGLSYPVLLGGAALTRSYVEKDLAEVYRGDVHYAQDAFAGLTIMEQVMASDRQLNHVPSRPPRPNYAQRTLDDPVPRRFRTGFVDSHSTPTTSRITPDRPVRDRGDLTQRPVREPRQRGELGEPREPGKLRELRELREPGPSSDSREPRRPSPTAVPREPARLTGFGDPHRSRTTRPVPGGIEVPTPPFFGVRESSATLAEVLPYLNKQTLFTAHWGLTSGSQGPTSQELIATQGEPRLATLLNRVATDRLLDFRVVWGYWRCFSQGNDLVLVNQPQRFSFPRQEGLERLCVADYFRDETEMKDHGPDVVAFQLVTIGERMSQRAQELFTGGSYRDYYELHGLSVQLAEAFAQFWHKRIRTEWKKDTGRRYSFGYSACPDLSQRQLIMELLNPEFLGVTLSEEYMLHPEQSTEAMIVHHDEARHFSMRS